ncbi:MAG: hypothetical protein MUC53_04550 [Candidatus Contendobacter sp.]|nr:hypothetical protein [Candidatus Contendobacter sp.]
MNISSLLLAFGLCVGLIVLLIRPARAWGWVDRPTTRKHRAFWYCRYSLIPVGNC